MKKTVKVFAYRNGGRVYITNKPPIMSHIKKGRMQMGFDHTDEQAFELSLCDVAQKITGLTNGVLPDHSMTELEMVLSATPAVKPEVAVTWVPAKKEKEPKAPK